MELQINIIPTPIKDIYHYDFASQLSLTKTLLRFQEHYESPNNEFRTRPFTLGEYRKWYSDVNGAFTYYTDWCGFNIPSYVFNSFINGDFDPLDKREKQFLNLIKNINKDKFYIIATYKDGGNETIEHELVHGLYYLNEEYRNIVNKTIEKYDVSAIKNHLLNSGGYCEDVLNDEINAYLSTKDESYFKYYNLEYSHKLKEKLILIKEQYFPK